MAKLLGAFAVLIGLGTWQLQRLAWKEALIAAARDWGGMEGADRLPGFMAQTLFKRLKVEGFIIFDAYPEHHANFQQHARPLVEGGQVKVREHVIDELESAPQGLIDLLKGDNFGKVVVRVGA